MVSPAKELAGYEAAQEGVTLFAQLAANYLRLSGETRVDFLQRQTTNDVALLAPGRAVTTILTSPTARILDVILLVAEADAIGMVTVPGRGPATAQFLQGRIFFMDRVEVSDASPDFAQFVLGGPQAGDLLNQMGLDVPPAEDEVAAVEVAGADVRVVGVDGAGFRLLVPSASSDAVSDRFSRAGAVMLSPEAFDALRVEAGLPGARELTEDYTPLETNLSHAVSHTKGCYTGQEVIARQVNYDKVTRRMVGLRLASQASAGARVLADGKSVGTVTSAAHSPRFGEIALAIVKRPHEEPGSRLDVSEGDDKVEAEVVSLPFGS